MNWCFWTMVLERTPESPLNYKETNLAILKEINPEYSLEGLTLKLNLQYSGHLMWGADSLVKTLMLGKTDVRRSERQRMWWLDGITNLTDTSLSKLWKMVRDKRAWHQSPDQTMPKVHTRLFSVAWNHHWILCSKPVWFQFWFFF